MQFKIEQVALCPTDPAAAIELLTAMGLKDWAHDNVVALGQVHGNGPERNVAALAFNYEGFTEKRELEVLHYTDGANWIDPRTVGSLSPFRPRVSHLGMHCSHGEMENWKEFFHARGIPVAQEVVTWSHTNPVIAGKRWYNYVIFDTYAILGVDIKFIVRRNAETGAP
jgi:hypothetical protein